MTSIDTARCFGSLLKARGKSIRNSPSSRLYDIFANQLLQNERKKRATEVHEKEGFFCVFLSRQLFSLPFHSQKKNEVWRKSDGGPNNSQLHDETKIRYDRNKTLLRMSLKKGR